MTSTFGMGKFGDQRQFGPGVSVDPRTLKDWTTIKFENFAGGYGTASGESVMDISFNFGGPDVEVNRQNKVVRAPGTNDIELVTAGRTPKQLIVHAGLDSRSELLVLAQPYLGRKRADTIQWIYSNLDDREQYFAATYGDIQLLSNSYKVYRHVAGQSSIYEVPTLDLPAPRAMAVWAARLWYAGFVIDGTFEPSAIGWSGVTNWNDRDPNNGFGFEFMIQDSGFGDEPVVLKPMSIDFMVILNRKSIWTAKRTGDLFEPAEIEPRVTGNGCINRRCAQTTGKGVVYVSDEGVELFAGGQDTDHLSGAIDGEIADALKNSSGSIWTAYNPSDRKFFMSIPGQGTYVLDMLRQRWSRRSIQAIDAVGFSQQVHAPTWGEDVGTWAEATDEWRDNSPKEAGNADTIFVGQTFEGDYRLVKESYGAKSYFFIPQQPIHNIPGKLHPQQSTKIFQFRSATIRYVGEGSLGLYLPNTRGRMVKVVDIDLGAASESTEAIETFKHSGRGIDCSFEILSGELQIEGIDLSVKELSERRETIFTPTSSVRRAAAWIKEQGLQRKRDRYSFDVIVEDDGLAKSVKLSPLNVVAGVPSSPITVTRPNLPFETGVVKTWAGTVAAPYNTAAYEVRGFTLTGVTTTQRWVAAVALGGAWTTNYNLAVAPDGWELRLYRVSDNTEMTDWSTLPRWTSDKGNGPDLFVNAPTAITVTLPAAAPVVTLPDDYDFAGNVAAPYNDGTYEVRVYVRTDIEYLMGTLPIAVGGVFGGTVTMQTGQVVLRIFKTVTGEQPYGATPWYESSLSGVSVRFAGLLLKYYEQRKNAGSPTNFIIPDDGVLHVAVDDPDAVLTYQVIDTRQLPWQILGEYKTPSGLVRSFLLGENRTDPMEIRDQCFTYDMALCLVATVELDDYEQAERYAVGFLRSQLNSSNEFNDGLYPARDGAWAFAITQFAPDQQTNTFLRNGAVAWCAYALARFVDTYSASPLVPLIKAALTKTAIYLQSCIEPETGLVKGGFGDGAGNPDLVVPWSSTEHNIDSWFFFDLLADVLRDQRYRVVADSIRDAMFTYLWDDATQAFWQGATLGANDGAKALDTHSWGALFCLANGDEAKAATSLARMEALYLTTKADLILGTRYGYSAYIAADGQNPATVKTIWQEGTGGVVRAYRLGGYALYKTRLSNMAQNQLADGSFRYALDPDAVNGIHIMPAVAATAWYIRGFLPYNYWKNLRGLKNGL